MLLGPIVLHSRRLVRENIYKVLFFLSSPMPSFNIIHWPLKILDFYDERHIAKYKLASEVLSIRSIFNKKKSPVSLFSSLKHFSSISFNSVFSSRPQLCGNDYDNDKEVYDAAYGNPAGADEDQNAERARSPSQSSLLLRSGAKRTCLGKGACE